MRLESFDPTKSFVLLGTPRSGSTALCSYLSHYFCPKTTYLWEYFDVLDLNRHFKLDDTVIPENQDLNNFANYYVNMPIIGRRGKIVLSKLFHFRWHDSPTARDFELKRRLFILSYSMKMGHSYFFKAFGMHLLGHPEVCEFLREHFQVILLERRNHLAQFLSAVRAQHTGEWHIRAGSGQNEYQALNSKSVHVTRDAYNYWSQNDSLAYLKMKQQFADKVLGTLYYEDFADNLDYLRNFFGLPLPGSTGPIPCDYIKSQSSDFAWVANLGEVKSWFNKQS